MKIGFLSVDFGRTTGTTGITIFEILLHFLLRKTQSGGGLEKLHMHGGKLGENERDIIKAAVCFDASHFNEDG